MLAAFKEYYGDRGQKIYDLTKEHSGMESLRKHHADIAQKQTKKAVEDLLAEDVEEYQQDYTDMDRLSRELYRWPVLNTDGEAKLLVKSAGDHDGIAAWGRVHSTYKRRTCEKAWIVSMSASGVSC